MPTETAIPPTSLRGVFADLYIDGGWRAGSTNERFAVTDPCDGSTIAQFAVASQDDCDAAVESAAAAFPAWSTAAPRARSEILRNAWEILVAESDILIELMVRENGKSWSDAKAEAGYATEFFRWFAEEAVRIPGEYRLSPAGDKRIVVTHHPIGVAVLITPWNFPAAMAIRKLAPALAAGCTVVLKPATETPLTAAYIVSVLERAGVPSGVVNLITPRPAGPAIARVLAHPAVRKLSFTGSTEVGRELLKTSASRVINTSMELGGNAPLIVLPGADLEIAVEGAFLAKMRNGGSACTSANRFYVHESIHDVFVARMTERLAAMQVGPGVDRSNELGALVSLKERDKVAALVTTAITEGAHLGTGGTAFETGAFYAPTLLTNVTHGSTINVTEIFGPVTAIVKFSDVDEAVRHANDSEFGLMAYVFGEERHAVQVAQRLDVGMVAINRGVVSDPAAPFGGTKQSGLGREGSTEGILEFLETQYLAVTA